MDKTITSNLLPIPAGALFTITTGAWSSYQVAGVFRALSQIDTGALLLDYLEINPEQKERYRFNESKFLAWVYSKNLFEPVECWEWHLCDYSTASSEGTYVYEIDNPNLGQ